MIEQISAISINGAGGMNQRPLFGGYIYNLDYNVVMGPEGATTMSVGLIGENGDYSISDADMGTSNAYSVSLSNLNTTMYLKKFKKSISPRGKTLELEFIDGSYKLDTYTVGLYKKWGIANGATATNYLQFGDTPENLIIVGREFHGCDRDHTGNFDTLGVIRNECAPCFRDSDVQAQLTLVDCKEAIKYEILEVQYNFSDLMAAIEAKGFSLKNAYDPNPKYFAEYTGSLREVLSNWCSDFGWTFFWENGKIVFLDLRNVINVNATIQSLCPNIESYEEEHTLDGTIQTGIITNYSREGHATQKYDCKSAVYLSIPAYSNTNAPTTSLRITSTINDTAASLAIYSKELRNLFWWFDNAGYGMQYGGKITPGLEMPEIGLTILSNPVYCQNLPSLNGNVFDYQIANPLKAQYAASGEDTSISFLEAIINDSSLRKIQDSINEDDLLRQCVSVLSIEDQWKFASNASRKYFFVAAFDEESENRYLNDEISYAQEFIGKHHIFVPDMADPQQAAFFESPKYIEKDTACGITSLYGRYREDGRLKFDSIGNTHGDGFTYYDNPGVTADGDIQTLQDLPFAKFLDFLRTTYNEAGNTGYQATTDFKMVCVSTSSAQWYPAPGSYTGNKSSPIAKILNKDLIEQAWSLYPMMVEGQIDKNGSDITRIVLEKQGLSGVDTNRSKVYLFVGTKVDSTSFQMGVTQSNNPTTKIGTLFNGSPVNPNDNPDEIHEVVYQYPELKCLQLGFNSGGCKGISFKTPAATFRCFQPANAPYGVVVEKTRVVPQRTPKYETAYLSSTPVDKNVLKYDYIYRNLSDSNIKVLTRDNTNAMCVYSKETIRGIHEYAIKNLEVNQIVPLIKKSFSIIGTNIGDVSLSIEDGLQAIRISSDKAGIKTNYIFGTSKMVRPKRPEVYTLLQQTTRLGKITNPDSSINTFTSVPKT
jgi:hypothetical protein